MNYETKLNQIQDDLFRYEYFEDGDLQGFVTELEDIEESFTDDTTVEELRLHQECEALVGLAEIHFANIDAECERECIRDEMAYEGSRHLS
jgi:hypothetical protein